MDANHAVTVLTSVKQAVVHAAGDQLLTRARVIPPEERGANILASHLVSSCREKTGNVASSLFVSLNCFQSIKMTDALFHQHLSGGFDWKQKS